MALPSRAFRSAQGAQRVWKHKRLCRSVSSAAVTKSQALIAGQGGALDFNRWDRTSERGHDVGSSWSAVTKSIRWLSTGPTSPVVNVESLHAKTQAHVGDADIRIDKNNGVVELDWSIGGSSETGYYPFVWMRDNCRCPKCCHPVTHGRTLPLKDLQLDVEPRGVKVDSSQNTLVVAWSDDHEGLYPLDWLHSKRFPKQGKQNVDMKVKIKAPTTWGAEMVDKIPSTDYDKFLTDSESLYNWMVNLEEYGIVRLEGVPSQVGEVFKFGDRIAFLRTTSYGNMLSVKVTPTPSNLAYTSGNLGLHTDFTYYHYSPGIESFHCISQADVGGDSQYADGFRVAEMLKEEDPEAFHTLTTTSVQFRDAGTETYKFHMVNWGHVISLAPNGEVKRIRFNHPTIDPSTDLTIDQVKKLYRALKKFNDLLYDERTIIKTKLTPGDFMVVDNRRVLHGRTAYTVNKGSQQRLLESGFVDWDDMLSKRRVLMQELGKCD